VQPADDDELSALVETGGNTSSALVEAKGETVAEEKRFAGLLAFSLIGLAYSVISIAGFATSVSASSVAAMSHFAQAALLNFVDDHRQLEQSSLCRGATQMWLQLVTRNALAESELHARFKSAGMLRSEMSVTDLLLISGDARNPIVGKSWAGLSDSGDTFDLVEGGEWVCVNGCLHHIKDGVVPPDHSSSTSACQTSLGDFKLCKWAPRNGRWEFNTIAPQTCFDENETSGPTVLKFMSAYENAPVSEDEKPADDDNIASTFDRSSCLGPLLRKYQAATALEQTQETLLNICSS